MDIHTISKEDEVVALDNRLDSRRPDQAALFNWSTETELWSARLGIAKISRTLKVFANQRPWSKS